MSSMLEQAIIDADQLKEAAQKNAEETIVEKYQVLIPVNLIISMDILTLVYTI